MDGEIPQGGRRLRARRDAAGWGSARLVFRVEDQTGRLLRRVPGPRNAQEALALYWRQLGRSLTGAGSRDELDRSIDLARSRQNQDASTSPELPLPSVEEAAASVAPKRRRPRSRPEHDAAPDVLPMPQHDLFTDDEPAAPPATRSRSRRASSDAAPQPDPPPVQPRPADPPEVDPPEVDPEDLDPVDVGPEDVSPEDADQEDADLGRTDPDKADPVLDETVARPAAHDPDVAAAALLAVAREPEARLLEPQAIMLQRVDPRQFRSTDRPDGYLYHVTNGQDAETGLRQGLAINPLDPVILTERPGVLYWLSVLAEDFDVILDGPADLVVLRMRRHAVEDWLEPDPHASRSAGCGCFLLTGGDRRQSG